MEAVQTFARYAQIGLLMQRFLNALGDGVRRSCAHDAWWRLMCVCAIACSAACGTMHRPATLKLGPPIALAAIEPVVVVLDESQSSQATLSSFMISGSLVRCMDYIALESTQKHPCVFAVHEPKEGVAVRGVCVLLPGILGIDSAIWTQAALSADGWRVLTVAPALVDCVLEVMREHADAPLRERGALVAAEFDRIVFSASVGTITHLMAMVKQWPDLNGKPVLLIGESLGALLGVGLAASGVVPFDAAVFVAGGGSLIDVIEGSVIRRAVFGDLPMTDPEFCSGFRETVKRDPLQSARALCGGPIVVLSATNDKIVPSATQDALWEALGKPPRYTYDGGHLSLFSGAFFTIVPVIREVANTIGTRGVAANALFEMVLSDAAAMK